MKIGEIFVELFAKTKGLKDGLNKAITSIKKFANRAKNAIMSIKNAFSRLGGFIGQWARRIGLAIGAAFIAATVAGARFEDAMLRTFTIVGRGAELPQEAIAALTEEARRLGRETLFSSTEAAKGMNILALAGFEVEEILSAIEPVTNVAIAGNLELADATDIVASALRGFGLEATEATRVADVMAAATTRSNVTMGFLGDSMKFVAPIAKSVGWTMEQAAAAIGILGDAGIKGSMAGTTLRRVIVSLVKPTSEAQKALDRLGVQVTDSSGNLKSIVDIIRQLANANIKAADTFRIFGVRGAGVQAIVDRGADALERLTKNLEKSGGTAKRIADAFRTTLIGRTKDMIASLNELAITFFNAYSEPLTDAVFALRNWILEIQQALDANDKLKKIMEVVLKALSPIEGGFKKMSDAVLDFINNLTVEDVERFIETLKTGWKDTFDFIINLIPILIEAFKAIPIALKFLLLLPKKVQLGFATIEAVFWSLVDVAAQAGAMVINNFLKPFQAMLGPINAIRKAMHLPPIKLELDVSDFTNVATLAAQNVNNIKDEISKIELLGTTAMKGMAQASADVKNNIQAAAAASTGIIVGGREITAAELGPAAGEIFVDGKFVTPEQLGPATGEMIVDGIKLVVGELSRITEEKAKVEEKTSELVDSVKNNNEAIISALSTTANGISNVSNELNSNTKKIEELEKRIGVNIKNQKTKRQITPY